MPMAPTRPVIPGLTTGLDGAPGFDEDAGSALCGRVLGRYTEIFPIS